MWHLLTVIVRFYSKQSREISRRHMSMNIVSVTLQELCKAKVINCRLGKLCCYIKSSQITYTLNKMFVFQEKGSGTLNQRKTSWSIIYNHYNLLIPQTRPGFVPEWSSSLWMKTSTLKLVPTLPTMLCAPPCGNRQSIFIPIETALSETQVVRSVLRNEIFECWSSQAECLSQ